jgi:hypothetical protein
MVCWLRRGCQAEGTLRRRRRIVGKLHYSSERVLLRSSVSPFIQSGHVQYDSRKYNKFKFRITNSMNLFRCVRLLNVRTVQK